MGEQALTSLIKLKKKKKKLENMESTNCFSQLRRQPVKNATQQLNTEPSGSNPPFHQRQLKLDLNSSSAEN